MHIDIKLTGFLYNEIMQDLMRPHPFALERVGFGFARMASLPNGGNVILLNRYHIIPDNHYVEDHSVGARIGSDALAWAMQAVDRGNQTREGIFHFHAHWHQGVPEMSLTDSHEIPNLIPGFQSVGRSSPHGLIILSTNHCSGWVWLPGCTEPSYAKTISVIGTPIEIFEKVTK